MLKIQRIYQEEVLKGQRWIARPRKPSASYIPAILCRQQCISMPPFRTISNYTDFITVAYRTVFQLIS